MKIIEKAKTAYDGLMQICCKIVKTLLTVSFYASNSLA